MLKLILIILAVLTFFYIFSELAELEHQLKLRLSEHEGIKVALFLLVPVIGLIIAWLIANWDRIGMKFLLI